jgi:hypothetical protein
MPIAPARGKGLPDDGGEVRICYCQSWTARESRPGWRPSENWPHPVSEAGLPLRNDAAALQNRGKFLPSWYGISAVPIEQNRSEIPC